MKFGISDIKELNKANIIQDVGYETLVRSYIKGFREYGKRFSSELREDKNPSCVVYNGINGPRFKDFSQGDNIDIFTYLQIKYNEPFTHVLNRIVSDFCLHGYKGTIGRLAGPINKPIAWAEAPKQSKKSKLFVKYHDFKDFDLAFWNQFGITRSTLDLFKVRPISHYWIASDDHDAAIEIIAPAFAYAYYFGQGKYKIYCPFADHNKWLSNAGNILQGHGQLPRFGELLVVTKSYKDVMSFYELGIPAVAPQSESSYLHTNLIQQLNKRFEKIIVYYDNDEAGIKAAQKHNKIHGVDFCYHTESPKDPSDLIKQLGKEKGKEIILSTIHTKWQPQLNIIKL